MYLPVLLALLTHAMCLGSAAGSEECEVTDVHVTNDDLSQYSFNLTFKNSSCTNKDNLYITLETCRGGLTADMILSRSEGSTIPSERNGTWKVKVEYRKNGPGKPVYSDCFYTRGLRLTPSITLDFDTEKLRLLEYPEDDRVDGWCIDTYEIIKKGKSFSCRNLGLAEIEKKFRRLPELRDKCFTSGPVQIRHNFDPDSCYCFVMKAVSNFSLVPGYTIFPDKKCSPSPLLPSDGDEMMGPLPPTREKTIMTASVVAAVVVTVAVSASLMLVAILCPPPVLRKFLALRLRPEGGKKNPAHRRAMPQDKEVLLLHARDTAGTKDLGMLKKDLQCTFKVYDIFETGDPERLGDPAAWLLAMLQESSGVKLLLVESAALQSQMKTLLKTFDESNSLAEANKAGVNDSTSPLAGDGDALLTFALRQVLCTDMRQDYSRVFVVRFVNAQQQGLLQDTDLIDLVVKTKRYNLPGHYERLTEDLLI